MAPIQEDYASENSSITSSPGCSFAGLAIVLAARDQAIAEAAAGISRNVAVDSSGCT